MQNEDTYDLGPMILPEADWVRLSLSSGAFRGGQATAILAWLLALAAASHSDS